MSEQRAQGNVKIDGFGFTMGDEARRLDFPRAHIEHLRGEAGMVQYRAHEVDFDQLRANLGGLHWATESASAGDFAVRDKQGRFELRIARVELPRGVLLTRSANGGVELNAHHASLSDMRLKIPDIAAYRPAPSPETPPPPEEPAEPPPLRQTRLGFLDAVNGELAFRLKVVLDLPVIGTRTLNQQVRVQIKDGAFDYRALDDGLSWLEGAFLDFDVNDGRFVVGWSVPLMATKEIISWMLDPAAQTIATFNRIPLRSLFDFRTPGGKKKDGGQGRGRSTLKSLSISKIDIKLSMAAPRRVEFGRGAILFGGDDAPGIVDLELSGALSGLPPVPGALKFAAGVVDMTIKDVHLGGLALSADRLHVGPIDSIEIAFDGWTPVSLVAQMHRVTATNLSLVLGGEPGGQTTGG